MDNNNLNATKKPYKLNITDVFLIVIIIIAASVLVYVVAETGLLRSGDEVYIVYTIDIPIIGNEFLRGINRISPGDRIIDGSSGNDIGEIQQVRVSEAFENTIDLNTGIVRRAPHPDHSRVQLVVRARATGGEPNFFVNGRVIMTGIQMYFRTRHFTWYGTCIDIDIIGPVGSAESIGERVNGDDENNQNEHENANEEDGEGAENYD